MNDKSDSLIPMQLRSFCASPAVTFMTALTAAALSPGVNAQEAAAPAKQPGGTNAPAALPEVLVKGTQDVGYKPDSVATPKIVTPLRDTPQTINVVPRQVIQDQNATTLRDVLRNVPGISFQAGEGGVPAGDQMTIRGFPARTDLFVDGVRDIGGYTRDSFNLEQVETFKGPSSAYSGRGSTGGSVNMVSKTPKLNPFYEGALSYGSHDYYRGTVDFNQPIPELGKLGIEGAAVRLNGLYHDQDFAGRDFIHDNRWALNPTVALGLGTKTRATLTYLHLQENNLAGYGLPFVSSRTNPYGGLGAFGQIAPLPFNSFLGLPNRDYEDIINDIAGLKLEHDFTDTVKLQNQTRFGRTDRDSIITAPRIVKNPALDPVYGPYDLASGRVVVGSDGALYGLNHELQSRDQTTEIFSNQTDLKTEFDTGKLKHTLVTGFEYSHEKEQNYLRSATGTAFPFPAQLSNPLSPSSSDPFHPVFRTGARNQAVVDAAGLNAFDTINITEKWIATAGLRGDVFSTTYNQRDTKGVTTTLARTDIKPTWRSGLVYKPLPYGSIFFGYGTSFNPSAEGLTLATNNVILKPETSQGFELGTKWDLFKEQLSVSAALFRTDKDNYRNTDPANPAIISTTGEVMVQGIELGFSGKITEEWSVYGGYAIQESEVVKSTTISTVDSVRIAEQGHKLSNTPEQGASISTTYALPYRFTIGTGFFFVDERFSNNYETQWAPGYWLQDGFVSWKANDRVDVRLNISNLWDKEYIDRVGGGHSIPGTGRTVILTAALKF